MCVRGWLGGWVMDVGWFQIKIESSKKRQTTCGSNGNEGETRHIKDIIDEL